MSTPARPSPVSIFPSDHPEFFNDLETRWFSIVFLRQTTMPTCGIKMRASSWISSCNWIVLHDINPKENRILDDSRKINDRIFPANGKSKRKAILTQYRLLDKWSIKHGDDGADPVTGNVLWGYRIHLSESRHSAAGAIMPVSKSGKSQGIAGCTTPHYRDEGQGQNLPWIDGKTSNGFSKTIPTGLRVGWPDCLLARNINW